MTRPGLELRVRSVIIVGVVIFAGACDRDESGTLGTPRTDAAPNASEPLVSVPEPIPAEWQFVGAFSSGGSSVDAVWRDPRRAHVGIVATISACQGCARVLGSRQPEFPGPCFELVADGEYRCDDRSKSPPTYTVYRFNPRVGDGEWGYLRVVIRTDDDQLARRLASNVDWFFDARFEVEIGPTPELD